MRRRSSISVASRLDKARRPPPSRRTRPFGSGPASRSFRPRPMVERASLQSAPSRRPHLPGREHPPTAFIKLGADGLPTVANRLAINHADPHIEAGARHRPSEPDATKKAALRVGGRLWLVAGARYQRYLSDLRVRVPRPSSRGWIQDDSKDVLRP